MLALTLAVCCSLAIGMIFKWTGQQGLDRTALLTANYAAAVGVAGVLLVAGGRTLQEGLAASGPLLGLGLGTGALLILGFFMLSLATDVAGMSLAIGVMRVSVVIPFVASWIVWNETPTPFQLAGLALAAIAFFMIARREERRVPEAVAASAAGPEATRVEDPHPESPIAGGLGLRALRQRLRRMASDVDAQAFAVLALLFVTGGAVDVTMKTFEEVYGASNSRVLFLLLAFGVAFAIGAVVVGWRGLRRGTWPDARTIGWGVLLGVVNYGSLEFILRAIEQLDGTFVFPANNIAIVLLGALLGVYVWGERLSRLNRVGLACAALALLLLNL
jgi:drug/metabolite transporter (DMT)-like permease